MPKTLFVGCDVSAKNNTVCLMDKEEKQIGFQTLPNTLSGATALLNEVVFKYGSRHHLSRCPTNKNLSRRP